MIAKALMFITDILNQELEMSYGAMDKPVVASSLVNADGSSTDTTENKIVISVVNIERETSMPASTYVTDATKKYGKVAPPLHLNLYVLVAANYSANNYLEANKMLSTVLGVLQANPFFSKQEYPNMQEPLEKLTFELFNVPINELSHIWSGIGAKYVPSVIYKIRMMTVQSTIIKKEIPGITGLGNDAKPKNN